MKRVSSVKLNSPKLASSISHFIAALIHLASLTTCSFGYSNAAGT
jgi:hypothetical protein